MHAHVGQVAGRDVEERFVSSHDRRMAFGTTEAGTSVAAGLVAGKPEVTAPSELLSVVPDTVFAVRDLSFFYGSFQALRGVTIDIHRNGVTALIGPSGCGKSTFLRCLNRMNDLVPGARVEGLIEYHGQNLHAADIDPIEVRRRIGMVFQKANPFPKSIYDNVAFGPKVNGMKGKLDDIVEDALRR